MSAYMLEKYRNADFYFANPLQRVRLHIAKDALAALSRTTQPPTAESYAKALEFLDEHGMDIQDDGKNHKRRAHRSILAAQEAAVTYATEKKRLTDVLNALRQEIYDGFVESSRANDNTPPASDLE
jgi:hypothetical protein